MREYAFLGIAILIGIVAGVALLNLFSEAYTPAA